MNLSTGHRDRMGAGLRGLLAELGGPMAPLPPMPRPWPRPPGRPMPPRVVRDPSSGETIEITTSTREVTMTTNNRYPWQGTGGVSMLTADQLKAAVPAGTTVLLFKSPIVISVRGLPQSFDAGKFYPIDTPTKAVLDASSASYIAV